MKTMKSISLVCIFFSAVWMQAQTSDKKEIHKTIAAFSEAGDQHSVSKLDNLLDANYRVVMNRLFGSQEVNVVPKSVYLDKIRTKEWGGDSRKVTIDNLTVNGNTAFAKVTLKGNKATFVSLMSLVKNQDGTWKLISDIPTVQ